MGWCWQLQRDDSLSKETSLEYPSLTHPEMYLHSDCKTSQIDSEDQPLHLLIWNHLPSNIPAAFNKVPKLCNLATLT